MLALSDEPAAVYSDCGCTFGVGRSTLRPHNAGVEELLWLPVRRRVDFKMATLVYLSLSGIARQLTWSPTVSLSLTKVVVSCALPTQRHVSSDGPAAAMEMVVLLLQVRGCRISF